jgi:glycosyltransferase involved in cell wall biosynthesis
MGERDVRGSLIEPTLSVVIPIHNAAAYLSQTIASAVGQSCPPHEIVLVDDCSTDDSGAIASRWARRDSRIRLIRHDINRGPGVARNTGLAACDGDYVFFLDSDDIVSPTSFELLRNLVLEANRPDVVIADLAFYHPCGLTRLRGLPNEILARAGTDMTISRTHDLVEVPWAVGNKVCRQSFLAESGIDFPVGIYEDMPWSFKVLLKAERIRVIDHPIIKYRQCHTMSITSAVSDRHLDFVTQCGNILDWLDSADVAETVTLRIFDKLRGYPDYLQSGRSGRVPPELLAELRRRAEAVFRSAGHS